MANVKRAINAAKAHPLRRIRSAAELRPDDLIDIAGVPALVRSVEPFSPFLWVVEYETCWRDGTTNLGSIRLPHDVPVKARRPL